MVNFHKAKKAFDENTELFVSSKTDPEKYNLNVGLSNLSRGLIDLEARLESIERVLRQR